MLNDRLDKLGDYPFRRLGNLLVPGASPAGQPVLSMAAGDPQMGPPDLIADALARDFQFWGKYPPSTGTPEWRQAVVGWLNRRYRLPAGMLDEGRHVVPVVGTREGLFMLGLAVVPSEKDGGRPVVLMPNPFYHVYGAVSAIAGAESVYLPAPRENGFLPDLDALTPDLLRRTALFYLCSPSNPQGAIADLDYLARLIALARQYDFVLALDECYAEVYTQAPPPGALEACAQAGGDLDRVVVFHSLSKRSSAPGLRSGFAAGDAKVLAALLRVLEYGGGGMAQPIQTASAVLWSDEAHVAKVRAFYRTNFDAAERILGNRFGFYRPGGGFYLWLDVGEGEKAAATLWQKTGLRTLPGRYMTRDEADGSNIGAPYLRVALVHPPDVTTAAISRLAEVL